MGSNIGNLTDELSSKFIYQLGANLAPEDILLLGVDLAKSKEVVLPAYNDSKEIIAKFNLNLLTRMNRELGANFDLDKLIHQPEYSEDWIAKSFLTSTEDQEVRIDSLDTSFNFKKGEQIHTEISRKYNDTIINRILENTEFEIKEKITDSRNYFADYILERQ